MGANKEFLLVIGNNIRQLRNERGMSQQELADNANIAKSTIQRIENGSHNPTILMLDMIAKAMSIPVEELIKSKS